MPATTPLFMVSLQEHTWSTLASELRKAPNNDTTPTSNNSLQHILQVHLSHAADQHAPSNKSSNITPFGWIFQDRFPVPVICQGDLAPPELIVISRCRCKSMPRSYACECHKQHPSCTSYFNCSGEVSCCNPYRYKAVDKKKLWGC